MIDPAFLDRVEPLRHAGMGTEAVGPWLYTLVRMLRPRRTLEVGLGYTTPFLLQALADAERDWSRDREVLAGRPPDSDRRTVLRPDGFADPYAPKLIAIDDYSIAESNAARVEELVAEIGLRDWLVPLNGDFRDHAGSVAALGPLDFVWFDCGGPQEYADFFRLLWSAVSPEGGLVCLHFTHALGRTEEDPPRLELLPGRVLRRVRETAGPDVEILSLLEPHKARQGSVTMLRRVAERERSGSAEPGVPAPDFDLSG